MIDYSELREHFDKKIPIIMSVGGAVVFINDVAQISSPITFLGISFTKLSTDDITFVLVIVMLYSAIGLMINLSYYKSIGLYKSATSQVESITEDTKNPP
jgi:hypothetical protein